MPKITAKEIEARKEPGRLACGDNLYLEVDARSLEKRWLYRYQFRGKRTSLGLGSYDARTNGLAQARKNALEKNALIANGVDPKAHKDAQKRALEASRQADKKAKEVASNSFEVVAREWFATNKHQWKNSKHTNQNITTLEDYVFPIIGSKPIAECDVNDVLACLQPIWNKITETASRVRGRMEKVFGYAKAKGLRSGENPAQWKNNLDALLPSALKLKRNKALEDEHEGHHAALPYQEVPAFMKELAKRDGLSARMLEFTILTASRTQPVLNAKWSDIDLEAKVWSIPAKEMKTKKAFQIPLSDQAIKILEAIETGSKYVFPSPNDLKIPQTSNSMLAVLKRMKRQDITVHGFRTSFRTWVAETGRDEVVAEHALAHQVGSEVERAYQRSDLFDRRRVLMDDWAVFLFQEDEG
jgi:integrase